MMPLLILSGVAVWSALLLACWPVAALVLVVGSAMVIGAGCRLHVVGAGVKAMKRWVKSRHEGIGFFVVCPFCPGRGEQALNEAMPWCSTCGCEYTITPRGATFDQSLKTPRFAWGKALNLSGGIKIGGR